MSVPNNDFPYTAELAAQICEELSAGKSMTAVSRMPGMPARSTIFLWLKKHPDFLTMYTVAKQESTEALVEEMLDIADDTQADRDDDGGINYENIQRARLRVDTRKWIAAKLKPKKYGDRVMHEGTEDGPPIQMQGIIKLVLPSE